MGAIRQRGDHFTKEVFTALRWRTPLMTRDTMKDAGFWRDVERLVRLNSKPAVEVEDEAQKLLNQLHAAGMTHADFIRVHNRLLSDGDEEYRNDAAVREAELLKEVENNPPTSF